MIYDQLNDNSTNVIKEIKLKEFDIKSVTFRTGVAPRVIIIGRRATGKTSLTAEILKNHQNLSRGTIFARLEEERLFYSSIVSNAKIHNEFNSSILEKAIKLQKQVYKQTNTGYVTDDDLKTYVILDNCLYDQNWYKDDSIRFLYTHGCVYKIMSILTMNYPYGIPPNLRSNIDYIFVLKDHYLPNRRRIWEYYCGDFIKFEDFCSIMDKNTENGNCLVIKNDRRSDNIEDILYWYKIT